MKVLEDNKRHVLLLFFPPVLEGSDGESFTDPFSPGEVPSSSGLPIKSPPSGGEGRSDGIYDRFHLMIGGSGVDGPVLAN